MEFMKWCLSGTPAPASRTEISHGLFVYLMSPGTLLSASEPPRGHASTTSFLNLTH